MRAIHTQIITTVKENSNLSWLVVHQTVTGNSYVFHGAFAHQGIPISVRFRTAKSENLYFVGATLKTGKFNLASPVITKEISQGSIPMEKYPTGIPFVKRPLARAVREADSVLRNGGIS